MSIGFLDWMRSITGSQYDIELENDFKGRLLNINNKLINSYNYAVSSGKEAEWLYIYRLIDQDILNNPTGIDYSYSNSNDRDKKIFIDLLDVLHDIDNIHKDAEVNSKNGEFMCALNNVRNNGLGANDVNNLFNKIATSEIELSYVNKVNIVIQDNDEHVDIFQDSHLNEFDDNNLEVLYM